MSQHFDLETLRQLGELVREPIMAKLESQDKVLENIRDDASRAAEAAEQRWTNHESRIFKLESNQSRTFWIWGGIAGAVTLAANALWFKFKKWAGWE